MQISTEILSVWNKQHPSESSQGDNLSTELQQSPRLGDLKSTTLNIENQLHIENDTSSNQSARHPINALEESPVSPISSLSATSNDELKVKNVLSNVAEKVMDVPSHTIFRILNKLLESFVVTVQPIRCRCF